MAGRRGPRPSIDSNQDLQVWHSLRTRLTNLHALENDSATVLRQVNSAQSLRQPETGAPPIGDAELRRLLDAYDAAIKAADAETVALTEALETTSILIALRTNPDLSNQSDSSSKRKKRRFEPASSPSLSDTSAAPLTPRESSLAPHSGISVGGGGGGPTSLHITLPIPPSSSSHLPSPVGAPSTPTTASTARTGGRKPTRRDLYGPQLPLQPGRRVAFRQPPNRGANAKAAGGGTTAGGGTAGDREEGWILAAVVKCIQGDRNRYEVQDVQDAEGEEGKAGASFNTTLKAIVPLPDPSNRALTYPEVDYPPGSEVMALYPDTTSFYRAKVVAPPDGAKRKNVYKVLFDDDGGDIKSIAPEDLAEWPK